MEVFMRAYQKFLCVGLFLGLPFSLPAHAMEIDILGEGCLMNGEEHTVASAIQRLTETHTEVLTLLEDEDNPSRQEMNSFLNELSAVRTLKSLCIEGKLDQESIDYIGDITSLCTLKFKNDEDSPTIFADFFQNWSPLVHLHTLDLSHTGFAEDKRKFVEVGPYDIKFLGFLQVIAQLTQLKNLNIGENSLFPIVLTAQANCPLEAYNGWRKSQIEQSAAIMSAHVGLRKIFMSDTRLGGLFMNALNFHGPKELDFSDNCITVDEAADFCWRHSHWSITVNFSDNLFKDHDNLKDAIAERALGNLSLDDNVDF
jgi:hypothetical protein